MSVRHTPWQEDDLPRPTRNLDTLRRDLAVFGYGLVEQALDDDLLKRVQDRLFAQAKAERALHDMKNPANLDPVNQWVGMLLNKGDVFFALIEHPLYTALVEHMIGPDYLISCVDAQIQHPGAGAMPLHTDQWWMPAPVMPGAPNPKISSMRRGGETSTRQLFRPGQSSMGNQRASGARADVSRRNGVNSRGSRTEEGTGASAQNALKHGLRARQLVPLDPEDTGGQGSSRRCATSWRATLPAGGPGGAVSQRQTNPS